MAVLPLLAAVGMTLVLDRIVAVVDDEPIFLSELRRREAPFVARGLAGPDVEQDLVQRMIDEKLEAREAEKMHLTVTTSEIDSGIQQVLSQAKLSVDELLAEVKK